MVLWCWWGVQSEHKDLQFVYAQHTRAKRELEAELARCRRKMDSLLHDRATYQKEAIDATALVARSDSVPPPPQPIADSKSSASAVQLATVADARISELERKCARYAAAEESWTDRERNLLERLSHVNSENERLSHVLVSERNWDRIQCSHELESQAAEIKKLTQQLDMCNAERAKLSGRVGQYVHYITSHHTSPHVSRSLIRFGLALFLIRRCSLESVGGARASEALAQKTEELTTIQKHFESTLVCLCASSHHIRSHQIGDRRSAYL